MDDVFDTDEMPEQDDVTEEVAEETPRKKRGLLKKIGLTLLTITGLVILAGVVLFNFGSMEPPTAEVRAQYAALQAAGVAPEVAGGFHVPIPGCKCHSDDPVLQMKHEARTVRQCKSCHGSGDPAGAEAALVATGKTP